jgi:hypothetical protein
MTDVFCHLNDRVDSPDGTTTVVCQCRCGSAEAVTLPTAELEAYMGGTMMSERAMPSLDEGQRERIITGICGPCWDAMRAEDEEEEGPYAEA